MISEKYFISKQISTFEVCKYNFFHYFYTINMQKAFIMIHNLYYSQTELIMSKLKSISNYYAISSSSFVIYYVMYIKHDFYFYF